MTRMPRLLLALLLCTGVAACDSAADFEIGGTYSGVTNSTLGSVALEITLDDTPTGERFAFTGVLVERDEDGAEVARDPLSGTGTYDHPAVTLTVGGDTVAGTASDDGSRLTLGDDTGLGDFVLVRR